MTQPTSAGVARPNPAPTHHPIKLKYNFDLGQMTMFDNGEELPGKRITLKIGDTLDFTSDDGPVDIELEPPEMFRPNTYTGGLVPPMKVTVVSKPAPSVVRMIWCGIKGVVPASARVYGGTPDITP